MRSGARELALLTFIADRTDRGGATVGEAAEGFGTANGLSRSTVLTMMERLRKKRRLRRRRVGGVFRYSSPQSRGEVLREAVESFVDRALGGSLSPFVAYLAEATAVTDEELEELRRAVTDLQRKRR
jgi:predicted transcriptional regulator